LLGLILKFVVIFAFFRVFWSVLQKVLGGESKQSPLRNQHSNPKRYKAGDEKIVDADYEDVAD